MGMPMLIKISFCGWVIFNNINSWDSGNCSPALHPLRAARGEHRQRVAGDGRAQDPRAGGARARRRRAAARGDRGAELSRGEKFVCEVTVRAARRRRGLRPVGSKAQRHASTAQI